MMTIADIEKIANRRGKASDGPWIAFIEGRDHTGGDSFVRTKSSDIYFIGATDEDIEFIAAAKEDISALLNEIRRLSSCE